MKLVDLSREKYFKKQNSLKNGEIFRVRASSHNILSLWDFKSSARILHRKSILVHNNNSAFLRMTELQRNEKNKMLFL